MATKTITALTAVLAAKLTDAAVIPVDDSDTNTRKATVAQLRTQLIGAYGAAHRLLKMNAAGTGLEFAFPKLFGAYGYRNGTQNIPNATSTTLIFSTEDYDPDAAYNNATGVYTAPRAGAYLSFAFVNDTSGAGGQRQLNTVITGLGSAIARYPSPATSHNFLHCVGVHGMGAGDTMQFTLYQDSGGAINVGGAGVHEMRFAIIYLGTVA